MKPSVTGNMVLVRPDAHIEEMGGISLVSSGDYQFLYSITGEVVSVPEGLVCLHGKADSMKPYNLSNINHARMLREVSMDHYTDIEVSEGDRVLFSYLAHCNDDLPTIYIYGVPHIFVDYGMLVGKFEGGGITPVNGYLLVDMDIDDDDLLHLVDRNRYGFGRVVHAGTPVAHIDGWLEDGRIGEGSHVVFEKHSAVRLEVDGYNMLNGGAQSSFFKLQRRDVLLFGE